MIFDDLKNAHLYEGLGGDIKKALAFFAEYDAASHQATPVMLEGRITVNRAAYTTSARDDAQMEAHRQYVDVMFLAEGEEALYYKPLEEAEMRPYDPAVDASLGALEEDAARFHFRAGQFAVFFPQDAHCPSQLWKMPSNVKKLIAKVPMPETHQ